MFSDHNITKNLIESDTVNYPQMLYMFTAMPWASAIFKDANCGWARRLIVTYFFGGRTQRTWRILWEVLDGSNENISATRALFQGIIANNLWKFTTFCSRIVPYWKLPSIGGSITISPISIHFHTLPNQHIKLVSYIQLTHNQFPTTWTPVKSPWKPHENQQKSPSIPVKSTET